MTISAKRQLWARRLTWLAVPLCFGAVGIALIAAIGAGWGAWHFRIGLTILRYAFFAATGGALAALLATLVARGCGRRLILMNLVALTVALGFVAFVGNQVRIARTVPAIHDVTTNLADPPTFRQLAIRADNLETVPAGGRADLEALAPEDRWRVMHREYYRDLAPVRVPWAVAETIERARSLAAAEGWEIALVDPAAGVLEATDTSLFFRFKDDVAIRVRPADGGGSTVDVRSISRVGVSDVGVNARRVRAFLTDLQQS